MRRVGTEMWVERRTSPPLRQGDCTISAASEPANCLEIHRSGVTASATDVRERSGAPAAASRRPTSTSGPRGPMPFASRPAGVAVTVVDDERVAQDVLVRAARSWDYQCQAAGTAEQALELLEKRLTPIVVTDIKMPGRGGIWLVREVRQ